MYGSRYIQQNTVDECVPIISPLTKSHLLFSFCHSAIFHGIDSQLFQEPQILTPASHTHEREVPVITQPFGAPKARIIGSDHNGKIISYQDGSWVVPVIVHQLQDLVGDGGYLQSYSALFHNLVERWVLQDGVSVAYS